MKRETSISLVLLVFALVVTVFFWDAVIYGNVVVPFLEDVDASGYGEIILVDVGLLLGLLVVAARMLYKIIDIDVWANTRYSFINKLNLLRKATMHVLDVATVTLIIMSTLFVASGVGIMISVMATMSPDSSGIVSSTIAGDAIVIGSFLGLYGVTLFVMSLVIWALTVILEVVHDALKNLKKKL